MGKLTASARAAVTKWGTCDHRVNKVNGMRWGCSLGFRPLRQEDALVSMVEVWPVRGLDVHSCVFSVFVPRAMGRHFNNQQVFWDNSDRLQTYTQCYKITGSRFNNRIWRIDWEHYTCSNAECCWLQCLMSAIWSRNIWTLTQFFIIFISIHDHNGFQIERDWSVEF